jgi:LysR family hydrogen peroxide-inducible transcriptional activator
MDIVQIASFVKVAEERSFTRAAQKLFVAKSALSRRVRDLEAELGTTLLKRGYHRNELTPAGEMILPPARQLVEQFEKFSRFARESAAECSRTIAIGFPPLLHPTPLKALLEIIEKYTPNQEVKLRPYHNIDPCKGLADGEIDIALIHEYVPAPKVDAILALKIEIGVAIPKNYLSCAAGDVALEDLTGLTYVTSENMSRSLLYKRIDRLMEQAGIIQRLELPHHDIQTLRNLVGSRTAFALCPISSESPANRFFKDDLIDVLPLRRADIFVTTYIGWNVDEVQADPIIDAIVNDIRTAFRVPVSF